MKYIFDANKKPIDVRLKLVSHKPNNLIKTVVYDADTKRVYSERIDKLTGSKEVIIKLPLTSDKMIIESFTKDNGRKPMGMDKSFELIINPKKDMMPLKTYAVDMGTGDTEFMNFIKKFITDLPHLSDSKSVYRSPSGKFKIVLFDKLKSYNGEYLPTPCMIGTKSGTIEASKNYLMDMSVNQAVGVLSHEYGHYYKNPLSNRPVSDEFGADLNGMTIFLGNGFGQAEYLNAFKKVFKGADSEQNRQRYRVMRGFAFKIYDGQYFGKPYNL